jgi:DNA-binding transcriptional ArsR family regulator
MRALDIRAGRTILNHMVYYDTESLSLAFAALADPTRRASIDRLASECELAVLEIAAPFAVSLPAVIKHLDVQARANPIECAKTGRTVNCWLRPQAMEAAVKWLTRYERCWSERLDRLATICRRTNARQTKSHPQATAQSAAQPSRQRVDGLEKIARWFGPRDTAQASVAAEIDLRVGGHYRISFTSEGGEQHRVGGVYREVVPTGGWCSAGPGIRHSSAPPSSASR